MKELEQVFNLNIVSEDNESNVCPNKTVATYFDKNGDKQTLEFCCKSSAHNKFIVNRFIDENYWVKERQFFIKIDD